MICNYRLVYLVVIRARLVLFSCSTWTLTLFQSQQVVARHAARSLDESNSTFHLDGVGPHFCGTTPFRHGPDFQGDQSLHPGVFRPVPWGGPDEMGGGIGVETGVGFYLFCVLCVFMCVCVWFNHNALGILLCQHSWHFCWTFLLDIFVDIFCIHFFTW